MSVLAAVGLGLAIGAVLGALGGGGAILTVPALVYLLGQSGQDATTSSLIIVGLTAVVAAVAHFRAGQVRWRTGAGFGVAGIAAAFAGTALNRLVDEHVLLLGFAALMIVAAAGMLIRAHGDRHPHGEHPDAERGAGATSSHAATAGTGPRAATTAQLTRPTTNATSSRHQPRRRGRALLVAKVVLVGLAVGFVTGFFGVGGGFVIVPALALVLGLPMPAAVGTSLIVIAINSAASLVARAGQAHFDWALIAPFTIAAMAGSLGGKAIADRLPNTTLNRVFAVLLLAVAAYTAATNIIELR